MPGSPTPLSSNFGSPKGSAPDLERTGSRLGTMEKNNEIYLQLPLFLQNASRIDNCVQTLSQTVASYTAKITSVEQIDSSLAARVATLETGAASASSGSGSARSWNLLGQADGSIAALCHGPGSSDENRNTRRRLDTFSNPDDENARSAVMLQFPCEQSHAGVSVWLGKFWATTNVPSFNRLVRIHCKRGSQSARVVFETRAKCQDFVARYKDDGILYEVKSPFAISAQSWCVNPNRHRTEKLGDVLHHCGQFWFQNYKKSSVAEMLKVLSLFPLLTHAQKSSAFMIVETGLENLCSNLHHLDTARCFKSLLVICVNPVFLMLCYDK